MRLLFLIITAIFLFEGCVKIPERSAIALELVSLNGSDVSEMEELSVDYASESELVFTFNADAGVHEFYAKLRKSIFEDTEASDTERLTNEPQAGDVNGEFTYSFIPQELFDPPVGNPVVDRVLLQVVIIDEVGTTHESIYSILLL